MADLVERVAFDEGIFGVPFFRVPDPSADGVPEAFRALVAPHPVAMADARTDVLDAAAHARLLDLGFHRVCTQVTFAAPATSAPPDPDVVEAETWSLSEADLRAHARGFRFSRFAQDPRTPTALAERWIATWLGNSLAGRRRVLAIGPDVVTYAPPDHDRILTVDSVSVIRPRLGHGRRLVAHLRGLAGRLHAREVRVTTEAENVAAQRLYLGGGFDLAEVRACFHFREGKR